MLGFDKAVAEFDHCASLMWFIMPINCATALHAAAFIRLTDPGDWQRYIKASEHARPIVVAGGATLRAAAISDVLTPKWSAVLRLIKTSKVFMRFFDGEESRDGPRPQA